MNVIKNVLFWVITLTSFESFACMRDTLEDYNLAYTLSPDGKKLLQLTPEGISVFDVYTKQRTLITLDKNDVISDQISLARNLDEFALISVDRANNLKMVIFDWKLSKVDEIDLKYDQSDNLFHLESFKYFYRSADSLILINLGNKGFLFKKNIFTSELKGVGLDVSDNTLYFLDEILSMNVLLMKSEITANRNWQIYKQIFFYYQEDTKSLVKYNVKTHHFERLSFFDYAASLKGDNCELIHEKGKLLIRYIP